MLLDVGHSFVLLYIFTHSTNPELSFSRKISTPASLFLSLNIGLYAIVPPLLRKQYLGGLVAVIGHGFFVATIKK